LPNPREEKDMNIDGIWRIEIFGLYGWESIGVLALSHGHVVGGGNHHYAVGSYEVSDDQLQITLSMKYQDVPRTLFGEARNEFTVKFEGAHSAEQDRFRGSMYRPDKPEMDVACRLKRRAELPW